MLPIARLYLYAAICFWVTLLSYGWAAPKLDDYAEAGYADFSNFYTAGQIVHRGQGHRLYDLPLQAEVQREFSQPARKGALPYMRPPFHALIFVPLTRLSYAHAYKVWVLFCGLVVAVAAVFLRARIPSLREFPGWVYFPAYFSYFPIAYGFALGQDCSLMLMVLALFAVALLEGKDVRAGCFLGLALIKFQLALPLVLILLLKRQFRVLAGFSLSASVLAGVSVCIAGWNFLKVYPAYLVHLNHVPGAAAIFPSMMPSLRGLVEGWMDSMHSSLRLDALTGALSLAVLVWVASLWDTNLPRGSKGYLGGLSAALLGTALAGYHVFSYDLGFLCPVALLASRFALQESDLDARTRKLLLLGAGGMLFASLYLLLIWKMHLNLMAVFVALLLWGYSRALKLWKSQEEYSLACER